MSAEDIDVHLLSELGKIGLRHGKLITEASHPELMQSWKTMCARAGLAQVPQLILADSRIINAISVPSGEVVVTTGLFNTLTLPEVSAVLGHELGHETSNDHKPRMLAAAICSGLGIVMGNEYAHRGGLGPFLRKISPEGSWLHRSTHYINPEARPLSVLGSILSMAIGGYYVGSIVAKQMTVRPTELNADVKSIAISGDPQSFISALQKIDALTPKHTFRSAREHFESGYPSLEQRINNLKSLPAIIPSPTVSEISPTAPLAATPSAQVSGIAATARVSEPAAALIAAS